MVESPAQQGFPGFLKVVGLRWTPLRGHPSCSVAVIHRADTVLVPYYYHGTIMLTLVSRYDYTNIVLICGSVGLYLFYNRYAF